MVDYPRPKSFAIDLYPNFFTYMYSEESEERSKEKIDVKFTESNEIIELAEKLRKELSLDTILQTNQFQIVATVPDNATQNFRKALLVALESSRSIYNKETSGNVLDTLKNNKFEPKRTRILNRTNAIAIGYSRKLMEDTKTSPFERKIPPLDLIVYCVDKNNFYRAQFHTDLGVIRQTDYEDYKGNEVSKILKLVEKKDPSKDLAKKIYEELHKNSSEKTKELNNDSLDSKKPKIIIAIHQKAFHSENGENFSEANWKHFDDGSSLLRDKVFEKLPKLTSNHLSLLGTDTKSRMLCGDVDYIDYDVPPVSLHEATLTFNNIQVSVISKFEQLPIERTIFESEKEIAVTVNYEPPIDESKSCEKEKTKKYQAVVSRSGIFVL